MIKIKIYNLLAVTCMAVFLVTAGTSVARAQAGESVTGAAGIGVSQPARTRAADTVAQSAAVSEVPGCACVKCGAVGADFKKIEPSYCGTAANAQTFLARVDKDQKSDGVTCQIASGDSDECPALAALPKYKSGFCTAESTGKCVVLESADANGLTCRHECCGPNGCVAPDWQQTIYYTPFSTVPPTRVKEADRDLYYAYMARYKAALADNPSEVPYKGPQALCLKVRNVTALNATSCVGEGGRVDIVYANDRATLTHHDGVLAPETIVVLYKDMAEEDITAIPYEYRSGFRSTH